MLNNIALVLLYFYSIASLLSWLAIGALEGVFFVDVSTWSVLCPLLGEFHMLLCSCYSYIKCDYEAYSA